MSKNNNRDLVLDTLKYLAILLVIVNHYIGHYNNDFFIYYKQFPYSLILHGLSGKLGVAIFGVISGMLSYKSGLSSRPLLKYTVRRYAYYVVCGLFANSIYYFLNLNGIMNDNTLGLVIGQSLFLSDLIYGVFWFLKAFFIGSVLCFCAGKLRSACNIYIYIYKYVLLAISLLFLYFEMPWIGVFLLGCVTQEILDNNYSFLKNKIAKIVLAVIIFVFIKRDSSNVTYYIEGVCSMLLIILIKNSNTLTKLFSIKKMAYLGNITMVLLINHWPLFDVFDALIGYERICISQLSIFVYFIVWFIVTHVIAFLLDYPFRKVLEISDRIIDLVFGWINRIKQI